MIAALAWLAVVFVLAATLTFLIRRPRLGLDLSLRGTTRTGRLYIVIANRGGIGALRAQLVVDWLADDGRRARVDALVVGRVDAHDVLRIDVRDLHRGLDGEGWSALEVTLRAANAWPARARLAVTRASAPEEPAPVRYAPRTRCPESADGKHVQETRRIRNDGVTETWSLCRLCRHAERAPLSEADAATQQRVRAGRAERARREMEAEFARVAAEESKTAPPNEPPRRWWRDAARDEDTFPPDVAFYVLELDPTTATWDQVLSAHRRLALLHHPDRIPGAPDATRREKESKMQEINAARDRLREHFGVKA